MESYYIELVIDNLYGRTPRLTKADLEFSVEIEAAAKSFNELMWVQTSVISDLSLHTLISIYAFLAVETKMLYRDQWREMIMSEIRDKLNLPDKNTIILKSKINDTVS